MDSSSSKLSVQHRNGGGVISKPPVHHGSGGRRGGRQQQKKGGGGVKGIKVVYISSPMMLTASAEEFRAVVQELTGRDSNVADHDLLAGAHAGAAPSSSSNNSWSTSSSSSSYSSFGRAYYPTTTTMTGTAHAHALPPQTMVTMATAGPETPGEYAAAGGLPAPPSFHGMYDDQAQQSLLYGQNYW